VSAQTASRSPGQTPPAQKSPAQKPPAADGPLLALTEAECAKRGGWVNVEHGDGCNSGKSCAIRVAGGPAKKGCISFQGAASQAIRP